MGVAADIKLIDPREPVALVPILRAGLVPIEKAQEVLPTFDTFHIGYVRDEDTLEPTLYLNKLPKQVRRVHHATSRHFHFSRWEISRICMGRVAEGYAEVAERMGE